MSAIAAAAISTAATAASSLIQSSGKKRSQKRAYEYQRQLAEQQYQYQQEMYQQQLQDNRDNWEMENAYESPSAQKERLLEAGYSPSLYNNTGSSSSITAATAASPSQGSIGGDTSFDSPAQTYAAINSALKDQTSSQLVKTQTDYNKMQNEIADKTLTLAITALEKELQGNIDLANARTDNGVAQHQAAAESATYQNQEIQQWNEGIMTQKLYNTDGSDTEHGEGGLGYAAQKAQLEEVILQYAIDKANAMDFSNKQKEELVERVKALHYSNDLDEIFKKYEKVGGIAIPVLKLVFGMFRNDK